MKEYPIIFSSELIPKILDGTKTQTRRVIKPQPQLLPRQFLSKDDLWTWDNKRGFKEHTESVLKYLMTTACPYGQVGDRLWVREKHRYIPPQDNVNDFGVQYTGGEIRWWRDNGNIMNYPLDCKTRPSIHMPRWASRITLEITEVRVQRVQEITPWDILAEGCPTIPYSTGLAFQWFKELWDSLNAKRGYSFEVNPWVWALSFKVI